MAGSNAEEIKAMERHIDPTRGARIIVIMGAVLLPLLLLFAGWAYFAMTQ